MSGRDDELSPEEQLMLLDEELDRRNSVGWEEEIPVVVGDPPTGPNHHVPCRMATPEELVLMFLPERQRTWRGGGPRRSIPRR